jgi:hypothetical protein
MIMSIMTTHALIEVVAVRFEPRQQLQNEEFEPVRREMMMKTRNSGTFYADEARECDTHDGHWPPVADFLSRLVHH